MCQQRHVEQYDIIRFLGATAQRTCLPTGASGFYHCDCVSSDTSSSTSLSEHIRLHHAGPQLLMASLREKYWIPRIRDVVKTVIHHCLTCYRFKVKASQQLMGQLPSTRIQPFRPFTTTGVDYAGPITIRLGSTRSKQTTKGYIAIFVCFVTGCSHRSCHKPHN